MKKILLSAVAFMAAMSVNAQEVCSFDSEALGLNSDGVVLTAGTVIGQTVEANSQLAAHSKVIIRVSTGPEGE